MTFQEHARPAHISAPVAMRSQKGPNSSGSATKAAAAMPMSRKASQRGISRSESPLQDAARRHQQNEVKRRKDHQMGIAGPGVGGRDRLDHAEEQRGDDRAGHGAETAEDGDEEGKQ